jgi:hypothetical protein
MEREWRRTCGEGGAREERLGVSLGDDNHHIHYLIKVIQIKA